MVDKKEVLNTDNPEIYESQQMTDEEVFEGVMACLRQNDRVAFREEFFKNHTFVQAQIYLNLDFADRQLVHEFLEPQELAEIYDIIDDEDESLILAFLNEMNDEYSAVVLGEMYTDNAADILNDLKPEKMRTYLRLMPKARADELKVLMNYGDETAGGIMTTEFVSIMANQTIRSAMTLLRAKAENAESIYYLYIVDDDNRLVGVLSLRDLILSEGHVLVSDVMSSRVISVDVDEEQSQVARTIKDYDFFAIPVVEATGELLGIITVDDILDVMDDEAMADYSGLAGVDVDEQYESPSKSAKSRLPWLITLLCLGMGTSSLISQFEGMISEVATLSLFITLITGTAGNAGTQSLAVAVRKLALPDDQSTSLFSMILREIITGLLCGAITGLTIMLIVGFWQSNFVLGAVVGIAMLCAITVANLAGSLIPILMERLGFDPAVASGPFITTLSDLTSVLIYFSIASQFLPLLK